MIHIIVNHRDAQPAVIMCNNEYNRKYKPAAKNYNWWVVDSETNEVLSHHVVRREPKQQVCTPRAGAWCNVVNNRVAAL